MKRLSSQCRGPIRLSKRSEFNEVAWVALAYTYLPIAGPKTSAGLKIFSLFNTLSLDNTSTVKEVLLPYELVSS